LQVTGDNAKLKNITLDARDTKVMALKFNFLTKESTSKDEFIYHVSQKLHSTQETLSGNTYFIKKPQRSLFYASADEKTADRNETVTLQVDDINEDAVYNWYDTEGNLIYTGTSMTVIADIARTYKVEVIADADGFKDYAEAKISLNPHRLDDIVP